MIPFQQKKVLYSLPYANVFKGKPIVTFSIFNLFLASLLLHDCECSFDVGHFESLKSINAWQIVRLVSHFWFLARGPCYICCFVRQFVSQCVRNQMLKSKIIKECEVAVPKAPPPELHPSSARALPELRVSSTRAPAELRPSPA